MPIIAKIAKDTNLPVIAANDAHMVSNTADEVKARQLIRSLRFNKWEELFTGDDQLYLKTDKELADSLCKILDVEIVEKAINNIKTVADQCNVVFENGKHYPKFKSDIDGENAEMRLRRLATEGIEWRFPNKEGWTEKYAERMEYELGVITKLGFCDYLCIVEDFLKYGRLLGKIDLNDERYLADPYNIELLKELAKDNVGLGIGPGRGSAVGSLVCYLIGITGIDPMKYNLLFERFLNVERVSMPDIDSDFKTDIRDKVLDYGKHVYGEDAGPKFDLETVPVMYSTPDVAGVIMHTKEKEKVLIFDNLSRSEIDNGFDIERALDDYGFDVCRCLYPEDRKVIRTLGDFSNYNILYRLTDCSLVLTDYNLKNSNEEPLVLSNSLTGIYPWLDCKVEYIEPYGNSSYTIVLNTTHMRSSVDIDEDTWIKIIESSYDMKEVSDGFKLATGYQLDALTKTIHEAYADLDKYIENYKKD